MSQVIKYANKRFRILNSRLKKYRQCAKPEHLHKVRTELKKIKTLFRLLAFRSKQFNASAAYKPLKHIFSKAGHIRESDVLHRLFSDYKLKEFEKNHIRGKKEGERVIIKFQKNTERYIKQVQQSHKQIKKNLAGISKYDLAKYSAEIENQLCNKLFQQLRQDELHPVRKQIKELVYLSQITNEENIPQKTDAFDKLQEVIGQWHDKNILTELLEESKIISYKTTIKKLRYQCAADIKLINIMAEEMYVNRCIND